MKTILTLDLGTTACKACLFDFEGRMLAKGSAEYPIHYPKPGWAEQDAEDWWKAACQAVQAAVAEVPAEAVQGVQGVGLSSQRETAVLLDEAGRPLRRALVWMDRRSQAEAESLAAEFGAETLHQLTGLVPDATFTATKLLWLKRQEPKVLERMQVFLQPKDYLIWKLTGRAVTDVTLASRTLLMDLRKRKWHDELVEFVGLKPEQLPPILESAEVVGEVTVEAAAELGIPAGVPAVAGAGDRAAEALGACAAGGRVMESTGTTTNVSLGVDFLPEALDSRVICSAHSLKGHWLIEQGLSATGALMKWLRDELYGGAEIADYDELDRQTAQIAPGAEGLLMLPFFMGARSTRWNPKARGLITGLTLHHTKAHLVRAAREAIAFEIKACLDLLKQSGYEVQEAAMMGGASVSDVFAQIKSSVTGLPFARLEYAETSSLGAAILALEGLGIVDQALEFARRANPPVQWFEPDAQEAEVYEKLYELYNKLYSANAPLFEELAELNQ